MSKKGGGRTFASLSDQECADFSKEAIQNAEHWYERAISSSENQQYGFASSCMIFCMEETMKALILHMDAQGFRFRQVKGMSKLLKDHNLRYFFGFVTSVMNIAHKDIGHFIMKIKEYPEEAIKVMETKDEGEIQRIALGYFIPKIKLVLKEVDWFSKADILRQSGMYTDFKDGIQTPQKISEQDYIELKERIDNLRQFSGKFFNGGYDINDPENRETIEKTKQQFLDEGWYEKIGNLIPKINNKNGGLFQKIKDVLSEILGDLKDENDHQ